MKDESNAARNAQTPDSDYGGPERRRHRVFVTRNTEYHFRDGFCIAVRDRRTGDFLSDLALQRRVNGGLRFFSNGGISPNTGVPASGRVALLRGRHPRARRRAAAQPRARIGHEPV